MRPFLNVDLGELPNEPEELYAFAHVANVACGGHAGDDATMRRALDLCAARGAAPGAHPSYPDREGFGRRRMSLPAEAIAAEVAAQCARLATLARERGAAVRFVKAHGALYHAAHDDPAVAEALVEGVRQSLGDAVMFLGPALGALADAASRAAMSLAREGFADRGVRADGSLVPRGEPGALVTDPVAAAVRARELLEIGGVDTVCVHGDTPGAVAIARAVRAALDTAP